MKKFIINENINKPILNDNFYKWFGNSKIIKNGKPVICYHGSSNNNIDVFNVSNIGKGSGNYGHYGYGIYFSYDVKEAEVYGNSLYKCFLKVENPFTGTDDELLKLKNNGIQGIDEIEVKSIDYNSFKESLKNNDFIYNFLSAYEQGEKAYDYLYDNYTQKGIKYDSDLLNDVHDILEYTTINDNVNGVPEHILDLVNALNLKPKLNKGFLNHQALHWITDLGNNSKEVTEVIKKLGYDGVVYGSEIVLFNPNQIKSIDNNGDYSLNSNNIYK